MHRRILRYQPSARLALRKIQLFERTAVGGEMTAVIASLF
jgi:hypothetical protein